MLDEVYSPFRRKQLEDILHARHPTHNQRLFLIGFLYNVIGMSSREIKRTVKTHNNWTDYSEQYTDTQIDSVCIGSSHITYPDTNPFSFSDSSSGNKEQNPSSVMTRYCRDTSIFAEYNKSFFENPYAARTGYEYEPGKYNVNGLMLWQPLQFPIYRSNNNIIVIDIDCDSDSLEYGLYIANQLKSIDHFDHYKFSGSKGFHLIKKSSLTNKYDIFQYVNELFKTVRTNLVSFTVDPKQKRSVNIDPATLGRNKLIRGYSINLKNNHYSIPINQDMKMSEIISISSDLNKVKEYILK